MWRQILWYDRILFQVWPSSSRVHTKIWTQRQNIITNFPQTLVFITFVYYAAFFHAQPFTQEHCCKIELFRLSFQTVQWIWTVSNLKQDFASPTFISILFSSISMSQCTWISELENTNLVRQADATLNLLFLSRWRQRTFAENDGIVTNVSCGVGCDCQTFNALPHQIVDMNLDLFKST